MEAINFRPTQGQISYSGNLKSEKKSVFKKHTLKNDEVNISTKEDKKAAKKQLFKRMAIGSLISWAATFATIAVFSIGRNPAKAAKVLKGTSEIVNPAYEKARPIVDSIIEKTGGACKTSYADLLQEIATPKNMLGLQDKLGDVQALIEKRKIEPSKEVAGAIESLKEKAAELVETVTKKRVKGEEYRAIYDTQQAFIRENKTSAGLISDFLDDIYLKMDYGEKGRDEICELSRAFGWRFDNREITSVKENIIPCPKEIIGKGQTLFHGTQASRKVYKNGFTPYISNQLEKSPREFGAGIYVTPDVKVASSFSSVQGTIIPVKLAEDTKIAFVDEQTYRTASRKINDFLFERIPQESLDKMDKEEKNAIIELLYQKVIKDSGYDAVYIPKGVKQGFNIFGGDINKICGRPQSQVIIYSPEKLEITDRGLKDRVGDFKDKIGSFVQALKYAKDNPLAGLL